MTYYLSNEGLSRGTPGLNVDEHDEYNSGYGKGLLFYPASQQVSAPLVSFLECVVVVP